MKSSEALRKARELIENDKSKFVCLALRDSNGKDTAVYNKLQSLFKDISVIPLMWEEFTNIGINLDTLTREEFLTFTKQYRLAWIDWMIPFYEEIGD